jgi:hypothetical protein
MKNVAPTALEFAKEVVGDVVSGNSNIRSSLKKRGIHALRNVGERIVRGGAKRKRKPKPSTKACKNKRKKKNNRNKRDVFDM